MSPSKQAINRRLKEKQQTLKKGADKPDSPNLARMTPALRRRILNDRQLKTSGPGQ